MARLSPGFVPIIHTAPFGAEYVINHPVNVDAIHRVGVKKAPEVGEHTDAVLDELGYDAAAIKALGRGGVV